MKTPRGYKRQANGKLTKTTTKQVAHKKKAQKKKHTKKHAKRGKGVGAALMSVGKAIIPSLLAGLVADEIGKKMKRGNGLKLLGVK